MRTGTGLLIAGVLTASPIALADDHASPPAEQRLMTDALRYSRTDPGRALDLFDKVLAKNPKNTRALLGRFHALRDLRREDEAAEALEVWCNAFFKSRGLEAPNDLCHVAADRKRVFHLIPGGVNSVEPPPVAPDVVPAWRQSS